jgi:probable rRNA maturation factor
MTIKTEIHFACKSVKLPKKTIQEAVSKIALDYGWPNGEISIAIVDDVEIHRVNREYLQHDYPTDVISFDTTERDELLEGEVIASGETAERVAAENGWKSSDELLLYIGPGMVHVVGLDDTPAKKAKALRQAARHDMEALLGQTPVCQTPVCGEDA